MLKESISFQDKEMILFGGKGGVGKTTCAAATALYLARASPDKKILIFSTDPAHSLSDSFDCEIGEEATPILDNLSGMEINADKLHKNFRAQHLVEFASVGRKATYFNTKQLPDLFAMSYPSSFSFMALMKIIEVIKAEEYDLIILDTAPTGHTLELLRFPDVLRDQIEAMKKSGEMVQYIAKRFAGKYRKDTTDRFLDQMKADVRRVKSVFINPKTTEFVPVTIPEAMGVYETERLIKGLKKYKTPMRQVIINGVTPEAECEFCASVRDDQERHIDEMGSKFEKYDIVQMPVFSHEIRGMDGLTEYGEILFGERKKEEVSDLSLTSEEAPDNGTFTGRKMPELTENGLTCILFGGKGGVGKTTCAAATALHIANKYPDKKVLIFSTDPAHSLSDSFDCEIGGETKPISDNLCALEVNAEVTFEDFKKQYRKKVQEGFERRSESESGGGGLVGTKTRTDHSYDRKTISDLVTVAPLGLDELMALAETMDTKDGYDMVVIDTAPSGHLLGLLHRPEIVADWFSNIVTGLRGRPYQKMMETYEVLKFLLEAKKRILDTGTLFKDAEKTEFVPVIILEGMSVFETERLLTDLRNLNIQSVNVVANKIIPESECGFCTSRRRKQDRYLEDISSRFSEYGVTEMPLFPHEIKGIDRLTEFADVMYGDGNNGHAG